MRARGGLELTDIVYTSGPPRGRGIRDREGACSSGGTPAGHPSPPPGGETQRLDNLPVLRNHQAGLLQVAAALRGAGHGRAPRPLTKAPRDPARHQARGGRQDRLPQAELSLRTAQDLDVPQALPRDRGLTLWGLADAQATGHEPAPSLPALPAPRRPHAALGGETPYERLREKTRARASTDTVSCTRCSPLA